MFKNHYNLKKKDVTQAYHELKSAGYIKFIRRGYVRVSKSPPCPILSNLHPFKGKSIGNRPRDCTFPIDYTNDFGIIGRGDINPSYLFKNKKNVVIDELIEYNRMLPEFYIKQFNRTDKYIASLQEMMRRKRKINIPSEQITTGYGRPITIINLIDYLVRDGDGVALNRHSDPFIIEQFQKHGAVIYLLDCDHNGLPINKLEQLINEKADTKYPVNIVFSNPGWDAGSLINVHDRRYELAKFALDNDLFIIEEYGEDECSEAPAESLAERLNGPVQDIVVFGNISMFSEELRNIQVIIGPTDVIDHLNRVQNNMQINEGLAILLLEHVYDKGIPNEKLDEILNLIQERRSLMRSYIIDNLSEWFVIKNEGYGTNIWIETKDGKPVSIPIDKIKEVNLPFIPATKNQESTMLISSLLIRFGFNDMITFEELTMIIRAELTKTAPI